MNYTLISLCWVEVMVKCINKGGALLISISTKDLVARIFFFFKKKKKYGVTRHEHEIIEYIKKDLILL